MTALTALTPPAPAQVGAHESPIPWHRMAWVTWRQHRAALMAAVVLLGSLAVYLWITGLQLHHRYAAAIACRPAVSLACTQVELNFSGTNDFLSSGILLQALPALVGAFIGAPLLAREMETGTFRYAWTQGFGRSRWAVAKMVSLGLAVTAVAGAMSALFAWYYEPYFLPRNENLGLTYRPPLAPSLFGIRGVTFAAWTLLAFALGALAGMLVRRVVPAMAATLAVYGGVAVAVGGFLRQHYLAPLVTDKLNIPSSDWVLWEQWRTTRGGRPVSLSVLSQVLQKGPPQLAGKGAVPKSVNTWQYLAQHGYTQWTTYQPASRFWPFQWIETGWLLALSLLLIAATLWLVRRRAI